MASTFSDVSRKIIDDSIETVLYIDDKIARPFIDGKDDPNFDFCQSLFSSFKNNNSIVDFYKFEDFGTWNSQKTNFFKGIDLLILDWKLDKDGFEFDSTLKILDAAIRTNSLHFINIYTSEEKRDLEDIPFYIKAYYSGITSEKKEEIHHKLEVYFEEEGLNPDDIFEELKEKTLVLNKELDSKKKGVKFSEIRDWLDENYANEKTQIENILKKGLIEKSLLKCYCMLAYILNPVVLNENEIPNFSSDFISDKYLFLNHTIIQISQKKERVPAEFYESFKDAIVDSTNNYLTIMGLEMRNRFKMNSAFIGKDIDQISDLAFFFHKDYNKNSEDSFYDFLKTMWRDQASSFLYNEGMELKVFDALEDYKSENGIDKQIKKKRGGASFENDLAQLNYYYNRLNIQRKKKDKIKFGDIFISDRGNPEYFLCITALCDCVRPENLHHMLYFVKGSKGSVSDELKKGDEGFSSYLRDEKGTPYVINWTNKPISIYIEESENVIENEIPINVFGEDIKFNYLATIKENYTQRIANNSFAHPMRVGIYFADRKDLLPNKKGE